jgi:hypothetical protein
MENRRGFRWNINEFLRLQREFELLQLPLNVIAQRHGRSVKAIMFKLHSEGLADYGALISASQNGYFDEEYELSEAEEDDDDVSELDDEVDETYDPYDFAKNIMELQEKIASLANNYMSKFHRKNASISM